MTFDLPLAGASNGDYGCVESIFRFPEPKLKSAIGKICVYGTPYKAKFHMNDGKFTHWLHNDTPYGIHFIRYDGDSFRIGSFHRLGVNTWVRLWHCEFYDDVHNWMKEGF